MPVTKAVALALGVLLNASVAGASGTEACVDAHVEAQTRRASFEFAAARRSLEFCGAAECPAVIRSECGAWLSEIDQQTPSIVPVLVTSADDAEVAGASLYLDGVRLEVSPGTSMSLDPGPHSLAARASGHVSVEVRFTANVGEKDRRVELALRQIPEALPTWPYLAFGGGVALGTGVFVGFGAVARDDERRLADGCMPNCSSGAVGRVENEYVLANVGLGIAAASLAGAAVYFFVSRSRVAVEPKVTGSTVTFTAQF